jgi:hypothetical protein
MTTEPQIPSPATLTGAPLRHRLRVELTAPIPDVWALVGSHTRLPEYSAGIESVEVETQGATRARVCRFRAPDGGTGPTLRERIRWEAPNRGYATSADPDNAFGLANSLSLVTIEPAKDGTLLTWQEFYDNADLATARASFDDGLADIGARLVARFGGRVLERYIDGPR